MDKILTGGFTIDDYRLYDFLKALCEEERFFRTFCSSWIFRTCIDREKFQNENITHMCWATGGSLVPEEVRQEMIGR